MSSANFKPKRTALASRRFLATARLSCLIFRGSKIDLSHKNEATFCWSYNSNLGPILLRFKYIAGFLLKTASHPHPTRIAGCSRLAMLGLRGANTNNYSWCNYFRTILTYTPTVPQRYGRTDGRFTSIIALCTTCIAQKRHS